MSKSFGDVDVTQKMHTMHLEWQAREKKNPAKPSVASSHRGDMMMAPFSHVALTRQALATTLKLDEYVPSAPPLQDHDDSRGSGNAPGFDDTDEHNEEGRRRLR